MPILQFISGFKGTSYKKLQDTATSSSLCCCFISAFTLTDIIFYKALERHSTLPEKTFLSRIFLC